MVAVEVALRTLTFEYVSFWLSSHHRELPEPLKNREEELIIVNCPNPASKVP